VNYSICQLNLSSLPDSYLVSGLIIAQYLPHDGFFLVNYNKLLAVNKILIYW
jgi:hypothetical protein